MRFRSLACGLLLSAAPLFAAASSQPPSSAITYQGQLKVSGAPANGTYDLRFTLYSDPFIPLTAAPPITVDNLVVSNGLITQALDFGFAPAANGDGLFLGIEVRDGASTGAYTALAPLVELTPNYLSQYALGADQARTVADNGVTSASIATGTITSSDFAAGAVATVAIADGAVNSAKIFDGSIVAADLAANAVTSAKIADGSITDADINPTLVQRRVNGTCAAGSSIRAVAADGSVTCQADGGGDASTLWSLSGNAGLGSASYLGTSDNVPLILKVNQTRVAYFTPTGNTPSIAFGGGANTIGTNAVGVTIGGGGATSSTGANLAYDDFTTISGGVGNQAGNSDATTLTGIFATIGGGHNNAANGANSSVGGGSGNVAGGGAVVAGGVSNNATGLYSAVAGGNGNNASTTYSTVAGGNNNYADGAQSTVGGGSGNTAGSASAVVAGGNANTASGPAAVVSGGESNIASALDTTIGGGTTNVANANYATVAGGFHGTASGAFATVGGGNGNIASGNSSTIPGGFNNTAIGKYSFAAGINAKAAHDGSFVWSDNLGGVTTSTADNQFVVRANGGVGINGSSPTDIELTVLPNSSGADYPNLFLQQRIGSGVLLSSGNGSSAAANNAAFYVDQYNGSAQVPLMQIAPNRDLTVYAAAIKPGGGTWSTTSDRRLKRNIAPLDGALDRLLRLRGTTYEYIDPAKAIGLPGRQTGFIAQEVAEVFPEWVSTGPNGYLMVTVRGFEALTVEALRELKAEGDVRIEALTADNAALRADNAALADRLARIEQALGLADTATSARGSEQP